MTDPTPQREGDPLEAAAREVASAVNHDLYHAPDDKLVPGVIAILRRHGLRAPAPDPDRAALVERLDLPARLREICRHYEMTGVEFDEMQAAARALAAPAERDGWRPIESAPKYGSPILLACPSRDVIPVTTGYWFDNDEGVRFWRERGTGRMLNPSAWMPLPPAPERQEGQDD